MDHVYADLIALMGAAGMGPVRINRLLQAVRQSGAPLEAVLGAAPRDVLAVAPALHTEPDILRAVQRISSDDRERGRRLARRAANAGAQFLTGNDADYPAPLSRSLGTSAPPLVTVYGDPALLAEPMAGIVGARDAGPNGRALGRQCAAHVTQWPAPVVSGGAAGVDTAAHEAALDAGGRTVVVLPQGLLSYPMPAAFRPALEAGRVALLSAFIPNAPWSTPNAVTRNGYISAFSRLVCVIEPRREGGSIRTGRFAAGQGKPVFLAPDPEAERPASPAIPGARPLVTNAGAIDALALDAAWRNTESESSQQPDLFP